MRSEENKKCRKCVKNEECRKLRVWKMRSVENGVWEMQCIVALRNESSFHSFKSLLKAHFFSIAYN